MSAEVRDNVERDVSVGTFVGQNAVYYEAVFERLQRNELPRWHLNVWGVLFPWFWAAWRGVWLMFWLALAIDMIAVVCLMQVVKFTPLLAEALLNPEANKTLIPRYSGWIEVYSAIGWFLLVAGRLWMGSYANRWYYGQYSRWRIIDTVSQGTSLRRVLLGVMILVICVPITTYRATQLRMDERACLNQTKADERVADLLIEYEVATISQLTGVLQGALAKDQAAFDRLEALDSLTSEHKSERSALRKTIKGKERNLKSVSNYQAITSKDRFDCAFIDDFQR